MVESRRVGGAFSAPVSGFTLFFLPIFLPGIVSFGGAVGSFGFVGLH